MPSFPDTFVKWNQQHLAFILRRTIVWRVPIIAFNSVRVFSFEHKMAVLFFQARTWYQVLFLVPSFTWKNLADCHTKLQMHLLSHECGNHFLPMPWLRITREAILNQKPFRPILRYSITLDLIFNQMSSRGQFTSANFESSHLLHLYGHLYWLSDKFTHVYALYFAGFPGGEYSDLAVLLCSMLKIRREEICMTKMQSRVLDTLANCITSHVKAGRKLDNLPHLSMIVDLSHGLK